MAAPVYTSWKEQPSKNLGKLEAPALDWCLNVLVISQIQGLTGPPNRCLKPLWNHFETLESSTWRASIHPSTHSIRQYFWEYLSGKNPLIYSFSIRQYFWSILHDFDVFFSILKHLFGGTTYCWKPWWKKHAPRAWHWRLQPRYLVPAWSHGRFHQQ